MDKDKYMLKFAEGLQLQLKEITTNNKNSISDHKSNTKKMTFWKKMLTPDMVVGTSIIFFLIIFGIWSASKIITLRNNELEAFNPSISDVLLNQPVELTITSTEIIPEQSTINNESTSVNIQPQQSDQTNLDPTLTFSPIDNSPIQLYIIPRQRAFVQIISDNVEIFNGRIVPGTVYPFSGNNKIQLITGNAAALKVLFNEQEIDNFGEVGEVINVIFTIDAITTPTSQNSPTPSATFAPTATIQLPTSTITPTVTPYIPE